MAKKLSLLVATTILIGVSTVQAGDDASGLRTRLVPLEPIYVIGKPMMLRVELVNVGSAPVSYDPYKEYAEFNGRLLVKGSGGETIPYIGPWSSDQESVGTSRPTLEPRRSVPVFTIDLATAYYIDRPGRYTIQHNGEFIPKSEPIEIVVQPGRLSDADEIVGHLLKEFQPGWTVEKRVPDKDSPELFQPPNGIVEVCLTQGTPAMLELALAVWQLRRAVDLAIVQDKRSRPEVPIEYLGQNRWGAVYARDSTSFGLLDETAEKAKGLLPHVKNRLMRAMEISTDRSSQ